jgi:hypothetical protein
MTGDGSKMPGIWTAFTGVIRRDVLLAWKRPGDVLNPLFFFAMVSTLFPLAIGSPEQLQFSGPGVVWVAALLATLLSLNSLFLSDHEDGSLDQLILSPQPLPLLALGKSIAHWLTTGLHQYHDADAGLRHSQPEPAGVYRSGTNGWPSPGNRAAEPPDIAARHAYPYIWSPNCLFVCSRRRRHSGNLLSCGLLHVGANPRTIRHGCSIAHQ